MEILGRVIVALLMVVFVSKIVQICRAVFWRRNTVTRIFREQGIVGPPYSILSGSLKEKKKLEMDALDIVLDTHSHDITDRVVPNHNRWSSQYGETFMYWHGMDPRLYISDPELAKQVLSNNKLYIKVKVTPAIRALAGDGLPFLNGQQWERHRKIINPAFNMDKLKIMVYKMAKCTISMLEEWESRVTASKDQCETLEMNGEFHRLTSDVIAHAAFGSSYIQGAEAFKAQLEIHQFSATSYNVELFIPGSQYLPTPSNIRMWKLDRKVKKTIRNIIESRLNGVKATGSSDGYGDDLLGTMLSELVQPKTDPKLHINEVIEECKNMSFAGHETVTYLLTWTLFLLCVHPEWQSKLREEVLKESGREIPDADTLTKFKLVNMVLLEALRLYSPITETLRRVSKDTNLGNIKVPKDTSILIPLVKIHRSKAWWGEDAEEFNPLRFANGISKASKHPHALIAFGVGPRACIGQTFAMLEAKIIIALILQRFSLSLSPEYKHRPVQSLNLMPQFGLPVIVKSLL